MLKIEKIMIPSANFGKENSLPPISERLDLDTNKSTLSEADEKELFIGYGEVESSFPYKYIDMYDRSLNDCTYDSVVLENEYLRATFMPSFGGKLWSLIDKETGRELLFKNSVIRPCNLAVRNAWMSGGVEWNYQWYAFPWQFCSIPMYVGVLQGLIKKGKVHDALCGFLATYAVFAGICVMLYPTDVFTPTLFICIQTMLCHGTMFPVGSYLIYSGHVQTKHRTFLGAMIVFAVAMFCAIIMNEVFYSSGILGGETFNMFFISRHFASTRPVYSSIHTLLPFPLNLVAYFLGFSAAAYVIFLLGKGFKKIVDSVKEKKQTA